jgi:hypothetical protein
MDYDLIITPFSCVLYKLERYLNAFVRFPETYKVAIK